MSPLKFDKTGMYKGEKKQMNYLRLVFLLGVVLFTSTAFAINYYSYQAGAWNAPTTWTTDPSGTTLVGSAVPANNDNVTVLDGITVTLTSNVVTTGNTLTIRPTGILNLSTFQFTAILTTFNGTGLLRIGSANFPTATTNNFVASGGGTTEYFNFGGVGTNLPTQATYNNLLLTNSTVTNNILRFNNPANPTAVTINGNLTLSKSSTGTLTLIWGNLNTNVINASIVGNTTIGAGCALRVGNFNAIHNLSFNGDFTNNGIVRFTNQASPVANAYYTAASTTTGAANVSFTGTMNSVLSCNGVTDFYVFIINKGIDQTYTLTVNSSNVANFALYAPNNGASANKALYMVAGTLKLNSNIDIPSLTEGTIDFGIPETCSLWINGATVSVTVVGLNGTGYQALSVFGQIRVSAGSMSSGDAAGLVCWSSNSPEIFVEGTGVLDVSQIWTTAAIGIETYIQTGGTTNIRANGENHAGPMFQFTSSSSVVNISGGTLNFLNGIFTAGQGIDIQCAPGNFSVTGGTININEPGGTNFGINSTVPFYNVNVLRQSGAGNTTVTLLNTSASTITIQNNLVLNANTLLDAGTNTVNFAVGGNFNITPTATYTPGNNTTLLNGTTAQLFTNDGTITTGLYNLTLNAAGTATLAGAATTFTVRNNLTITSGTIADGGKTIDVKGNVINSGTHTGAGKISLTGTNAQTIGGNGNGLFQNIELNNTNAAVAPVTLLSNQTVNGILTLTSNKILDIGAYNLALGSATTIVGTPGASRFIRTAGFRSDGGVSKNFSSNTFTFPLGTATDYTPATITFSATPSVYGTITMRPVANEHPNVTVTGRSLTYYWRTTSIGFTLGAATVSQTYTYPQADVVAGGNVSEAEYVPARFNATALSWSNTTLADITTATNIITFQGATFNTLIDGDYTAGDNNPSNPFGAVVVYYSRVNTGNWETAASWSIDQTLKWAGAAAATVPTASSPVVIGNGSSFYHTITVTANTKVCGSIEIGAGSTLNLGTTTGHNFNTYITGSASGKGTLRISSAAATAQFPAGDFGVFIGSSGGTVEYYNTGAQNFLIPLVSIAPTSAALASYFNLLLTPSTGRTITMPDRDLTVYANMTVNGGSATARALLNATTTRSLTINGNLLVTAGNLQYQNGTLQNIVVNGNVSVSALAIFDVANSGTGVNNTLAIAGNLINNAVFDMRVSAARLCNVTFTGSTNTSVTGTTGTLTEFNLLIVNKGTSQTPELNVDVLGTLTTLSDSWLTITNGTFKFSKASTITLTNVAATLFTIPPTGMLSVNNAGAIINIGNVASDGSDLLLAGKLQIINGTVNVGNTANANNNDIEYSGAGFPEIELQGGTLNVNGQIRKSTISTAGSLVYKQSGSSAVVIYGQNQLATKSKLQINSSGSVFNMSGTSTLTLVRGGGTTYQDLYLQAASTSVSGGTIFFGNTSTPAATTFQINCTNSLYNLVVDATTNTKTAQLSVNALHVSNDITINGNSVFNANGLNVTIGRNLINNNTTATTGLAVGGFRPNTSTQVTTFNGAISNQTITGVAANTTNFANLIIANSFAGGSVTASVNTVIRINSNLTLASNTFADGGNSIDVVGNVSNSATHTSGGAGKINLVGSSNQIISGSGSGVFGNITINNISGVTMSASSTINGILNFNVNCTFNINDRLLTLGVASTVVGNNASRYIETNGVITDLGVKKIFNSGASNFTFAIGVLPKYTPAQFNITANTAAGSITVKPINSKHPGTTDVIAKELTYYWNITSSGFAGLTVTHIYNYMQTDVFGTEASYVTGRNVSGLWTPLNGIPATVNAAANTMTLTGVNYLSGDFTAGEAAEFAAPLTYYSRNARTSNNWNNTNSDTWSTDPILQHTGAAVASSPSTFNAVVIASGHTINANGDFRKCATLSLLGTLDLGAYVGHDFGTTTGTGTMKITATPGNFYAFPAGTFTSFVAAAGGSIEYITATTGAMPVQATYNHLKFSGSGTSTLANTDLMINGNVNITAGTLDNSINNKNIDLKGNWTNTGNAFIPGTGTLSLSGTLMQTILRTGGETFYNLTTAGSAAKKLGSNITVNNDLTINSNIDVDAASNYSIDLKGNWVNNGTFLQQQGLVNFSGGAIQTINGLTTFYDLTINKSAGSASLVADINVINSLTLSGGNLTTTGFNLTLLSDLTQTGRIAPITGGATITGNVTQQRLAPGGSSGWALLAAPVAGRTLADWGDDFVTYGFLGSTGGGGGFISIYGYDETALGLVDASAAYTPATNITNSINPKAGYWVYLINQPIGSNSTDILLDVTGAPLTGAQNLNVSYTTSAGINDDGWNLVANPYCSSIDWLSGSWTKTNMDSAIYIYNADGGGQYASYVAGVGANGGSQFIPSSQGFMVKANAASPSLIAQEAVKSASNPVFFKTSHPSSVNNLLRIKLDGLNGLYKDETVFRTEVSATTNYDGDFDALKLYSFEAGSPGISTKLSGVNYSINSVPDFSSNFDLPIRVLVNTAGNYKLMFSGLQNFSNVNCFTLEDKLNHVVVNMSVDSVYSFSSAYDTSSAPRFVLHFGVEQIVASAVPSATTLSIPGNSTVSFANTSTGAISFTWDFGDSSQVDTAANPVHTFATAGIYTVTLTASNAAGCNLSNTFLITVDDVTAIANLVPNESITLSQEKDGIYANFNFKNSTKIKWNVYNSLGQAVGNAQTITVHNQDRFKIDSYKMAKGIYTVEFLFDDKKSIKRISY